MWRKKLLNVRKLAVGGIYRRTRTRTKKQNRELNVLNLWLLLNDGVHSEKNSYIHFINAVFSSVSLVFSIRIASLFLFSLFLPTTLLKVMWKDKKKKLNWPYIEGLGSVVRKWHVNRLVKAIFSTSMLLLTVAYVSVFVHALFSLFYSISNWSMHKSIGKVINDRSDRIKDQQKKRDYKFYVVYLPFPLGPVFV